VKFLKVGPNAYKKLDEWNEDYLEQTYVLIFDTTIPQGANTGEKILNLARVIFPELTSGYKSQGLWNRTKLFFRRRQGRYEHTAISQITNNKIDSEYSVDLILKTPEGHFVVKDFKDSVVTVDVLRELIERLSRKFRIIQSIPPRTNIFRVICVGKTYDQRFLDGGLEKLMKRELKRNFKMDLILEEKVGYSILWVDS
jgi:hypothetical protein